MPEFLPFTRPTIDEATIAGVADVLRSGWITSGPQVKAFEAALSRYCGGRPVRCFNSGTATLAVALRLAGIGAGDEVITTPLSWVATANVALEVGARPVFVDVEPRTRNIDLAAVEKVPVTPRVAVVTPVRHRRHVANDRVERNERFVVMTEVFAPRINFFLARRIPSHLAAERIRILPPTIRTFAH